MDLTALLPAPSILPDAFVRPKALSWPDSIEAFVAHLQARGYSPLTIRDYRTDVLRLAGCLNVGPAESSEADLALLAQRLADAGADLRLRRRRLAAYARFLGYLRAAREPSLLERFLAPRASLSTADRLLVALVALAGLRPAEVARLEGRDLRLRKMELCSTLGLRILPIHPALLGAIEAHVRESPLVAYRPLLAGWNGFALNVRTLHARFQRMAVAIGAPHARPEDLRREMAEDLLELGTPGGLVRSFLGKDRGRPLAPRKGRYVDLTCLEPRLLEAWPRPSRREDPD